MKAITIWQPYATLLAINEKRFETRGRRTHYRGAIAIHSAKYIDRIACEIPEIKQALARHEYTFDNLPTGAVLAIARLRECYEVVAENSNSQIVMLDSKCTKWWEIYKGGNEFAFGDFSIGRYAWEMTEMQQLPSSVIAKGQQGLWNWDGGKEYE